MHVTQLWRTACRSAIDPQEVYAKVRVFPVAELLGDDEQLRVDRLDVIPEDGRLLRPRSLITRAPDAISEIADDQRACRSAGKSRNPWGHAPAALDELGLAPSLAKMLCPTRNTWRG
jgi:hypothetical protein